MIEQAELHRGYAPALKRNGEVIDVSNDAHRSENYQRPLKQGANGRARPAVGIRDVGRTSAARPSRAPHSPAGPSPRRTELPSTWPWGPAGYSVPSRDVENFLGARSAMGPELQPSSLGRVTEWHRWFAWRPVFVHRRLVWLQYTERRWSQGRISGLEPRWVYRRP
jgi:hypothetical protein